MRPAGPISAAPAPPAGGPGPRLELLIARPRPLPEGLLGSIDRWRPGGGFVVLAAPPVICGGCGLPRSLFRNENGRTRCVSCAEGTSLDG